VRLATLRSIQGGCQVAMVGGKDSHLGGVNILDMVGEKRGGESVVLLWSPSLGESKREWRHDISKTKG